MSKWPETSTSRSKKKSKTSRNEPLLSSRNNPLAIDKASSPVRKAFRERFSHLNPILERGIDPTHTDTELKTLLEYHQWNNLVTTRTTKINLSLVKEFFAALSATEDFDAHNAVVVRQTSVIFSVKEINEFYGIKNAPEITYAHKWELSDKKKLRAKGLEAQAHITSNPVWVLRADRFKFDGVDKNFRIIKHVISSDIFPTTHCNDFSYEEACLTYAFFTQEPINVGSLIFAKACHYANQNSSKSKIPFPDLISALCKKNKVTEFKDDEILDPCKIMIGTRIFEGKESQAPTTEASSSIPPPQAPHSEYAQVCDMIRTLDINNHNMWDSLMGALNHIRSGIRGIEDRIAYLNPNSTFDQFFSCQSKPFTYPPWVPQPTFDPTPVQTSTVGGTSSFPAGTQEEAMGVDIDPEVPAAPSVATMDQFAAIKSENQEEAMGVDIDPEVPTVPSVATMDQFAAIKSENIF